MKRIVDLIFFLLLLLPLSCRQGNKPQPDNKIRAEETSKPAIPAQTDIPEEVKPDTLRLDTPVRFERRKDGEILFRSLYTMKPSRSFYPFLSAEPIKATIYYHSGPRATAGAMYGVEYRKDGKWIDFPFVDHLIFADVGFPFSIGDTIDYVIRTNDFKNDFKPGKYRISTDVSVELHADFDIPGTPPSPVKQEEKGKKPFELNVITLSYPNGQDSVVFTLRNNSNMEISLSMYPQLHTGEERNRRFIRHPFIANILSTEVQLLKKLTTLKGGESLRFSIPVKWDKEQNASDSDIRIPEAQARTSLFPGRYHCRQLIDVHLSTEFVYGKEN